MDARDFARPEKVQELLAKQLLAGRLSVFLGAGISIPMGLPDWRELLRRAFHKAGSSLGRRRNYQKAADELLNGPCKGNKKDFRKLISEALYKGRKGFSFDYATLRANSTLSALAALVMSSKRGRVSEVFTFNFDDLLERYLDYHGFVVEPVCLSDERFWASSADVAVYHAHGILPSPQSRFKSDCSELILGARSYAEVSGRMEMRSNQRMLVAMQSTVVLFIGLSGDDSRLQNLMAITNKQHARGRLEYWGVALQKSPEDDEVKKWNGYGVFVQELSDYEDDMLHFLLGICQQAAKIA
ncbi:MAG: SIR2 family protein [Acidobacteriaceae bacterium]|nr:SIR2 family protein [Acidobacteriaceae bacterium]